MTTGYERRTKNGPDRKDGGGVRPRYSHAPYTAAVQRALIGAGCLPDLMRTVEERTGLRRSLMRVEGLRLLWEEEKGWSAARWSALGTDGTWWCPGEVVALPEQVADWVVRVLAYDESARGAEQVRVPGPELEEELAAYVDPVWREGPRPETDPAWT